MLEKILTPELVEELHSRLSWLASGGGWFASIVDLSRVTSWRLSADEVRDFARRDRSVPGGRNYVAVAKEPSAFGMARMFLDFRAQLYRDFFGEQYRVVYSLNDAYEILGVHPEDFTERLHPKRLPA